MIIHRKKESGPPDLLKLECANCGAPLEVSRYTSACRCEHCGCYAILEERVEGEYTPHLILPFQISKEKAVELLRKEFQSRYFTPASLARSAHFSGSKRSGLKVLFRAKYSFLNSSPVTSQSIPSLDQSASLSLRAQDSTIPS